VIGVGTRGGGVLMFNFLSSAVISLTASVTATAATVAAAAATA